MYELLFHRLGVNSDVGYDKKTTFQGNQLVGHMIRLAILCDDLNEAFSNFKTLLNNEISVSSLDRGYLVFDAHVTDCGCHLRAQMLQEIILYFKLKEVSKINIFDAIIKKLNELKKQCSSLIRTLCWDNISVQKLGFPKIIKGYEEMIAFLEWNTDNIRGTIAETFPKTHNKPAQNKNDLIWDVTDLKVVLEFLFCSHFLSKNKIYNKKGNLDSVTIDFNLAFEKRQSLSKTFHCQGSGKHGIGCRYLKHANESKGSFISVVSKLQSRLASLSIAFLKSKSIVSCNIDSLIKYSPKHVPAMPNFLHFLILEREWGKKRTPILLAVRTFHGNEHCDIYFEARVKQHTFEWILQKQEYDKFEHHIPYLIITAVVTSSNTTKTAQQFAYELMKAQKKFRKFWLTFMSQHRQYPFEIDYDEEQLLKAQVSQDIFELYFSSKRENIDNILFDDHSSFLPKHIFTEYPSIFFNFQKNSDSKYGALVI